MNWIAARLYNLSTYGITAAGIAVNVENIKSAILFCGALILLGLQIRLHLLKIKNEKKDKK